MIKRLKRLEADLIRQNVRSQEGNLHYYTALWLITLELFKSTLSSQAIPLMDLLDSHCKLVRLELSCQHKSFWARCSVVLPWELVSSGGSFITNGLAIGYKRPFGTSRQGPIGSKKRTTTNIVFNCINAREI